MIDTHSHSVSQEFKALSLELKQERDYLQNESKYIEYEIDSVEEEFGELFRVWEGRILLGTFYKNAQEQWKATPFYLCGQYIKIDSDLSDTFPRSERAIAYIKQMYEGKEEDLFPEEIHFIAV